MPGRCQIHVALVAIVIAAIVATPSARGDDVDRLTGSALSDARTREEVRDLRRKDRGVDLAGLGLLITAVVGVAGLFATQWKQINDASKQREADRISAESAAERRFDEQFNRLVRDLGAQQAATRVGAAVGLTRFLVPRHASFHEDVTRLIAAHLKVQTDGATLDVLRRGFERAMRIAPPEGELDLSRANLERIDLSTLTLTELDLTDSTATFADFSKSSLTRMTARRANLEKANFTRATLNEARCRGANCEGTDFSGADLVSANLRDTNLKNARFYGARLQGARFSGANLSGTRFERANLADAHFEGALFAPETYKSVARATNWRAAHFAPQDRSQLPP